MPHKSGMVPNESQPDVDLDKPLTPEQLARAEGLKSRRVVYEAIYAGHLDHYRDGRSIRVTRRQWRDRWQAKLVPAGAYQKDPVRSERALRRAAEKAKVA